MVVYVGPSGLLVSHNKTQHIHSPIFQKGPGCFFCLLWPLFARAPRHWFLENFLLSAPGVQSVFFLLRSVGRRDLSAGPEQKKNTTQGVFFFAPAPGKGRGRRSPVPTRGQSKKKNTTQGVFFFCCGPRERQGKEKPRWAPPRGQSKKKNCSGPVPAPNGASPSPAFPRGRAKKNTLGGAFFLLWPRAGAQRASPSLAFRRGRSKKKTPWVEFFFCSGPVSARGFSFPCLSPGPEQKKTPWVVFFFLRGPRGRSLTHCGPGWRCLPLAGVVFSFCCGPARTGVVFFFCCGPARTLTHSLWAGAISARPRWCFFFFAAAPPGLFRQ